MRSLFAFWVGGACSTPTVPSIGYDGEDVYEALSGWWADHGAGYASDGVLYYSQAPEGVELPYATYFGVSEDTEIITTSCQSRRSAVQFNLHATTPAEALSLARSLRIAINQAPLLVSGRRVWHVQPDSLTPPMVGEGLGPDGEDCWVVGLTVDIPWNA